MDITNMDSNFLKVSKSNLERYFRAVKFDVSTRQISKNYSNSVIWHTEKQEVPSESPHDFGEGMHDSLTS